MAFFDTNDVEFHDNPQNRCPCILLLDVSSSMNGSKIDQLNGGLIILRNELQKDSIASTRVEIALLTFGKEVALIQDFVLADSFSPPTLVAEGPTPMGRAIKSALAKLQERKNNYRQNGIAYYRPWIFLITDGEPTDDWQSAAQQVAVQENDGKVAFFCIGVDDANMSILSGISPRQPAKLKGLEFREMFIWLSASLTQVSHSRIGEQVALDPPKWTV